MKKEPILYAAVFIALSVYVMFFLKPKSGTKHKKLLENMLFDYSESNVDKIQIIAKGKKTICQKEGDNKWQITFPKKTEADETEIYNVINIFTTTKFLRKIDSESKDLSIFGLDKPDVYVSLGLGEKNDEISLKIGSKNPDGSGNYALRNEEKTVFLIPSYVVGTLDKDFWIMRNKYLFSFIKTPLSEIRCYSGDKVFFSIKNIKGTWMLEKPVASKANYGNVNSYVNMVKYLSVRRFLDVDIPSGASFGLVNPEYSLVVVGKDGVSETLLIGREDKESAMFYAKRKNSNCIVLISKKDKESILPSVEKINELAEEKEETEKNTRTPH